MELSIVFKGISINMKGYESKEERIESANFEIAPFKVNANCKPEEINKIFEEVEKVVKEQVKQQTKVKEKKESNYGLKMIYKNSDSRLILGDINHVYYIEPNEKFYMRYNYKNEKFYYKNLKITNKHWMNIVNNCKRIEE